MRLKSRHYALIVLIVALGILNYIRGRNHRPSPGSVTIPAAVGAPAPIQPNPAAAAAWTAFDKAAAARDGSPEAFEAAAKELQHQIDLVKPPGSTADVQGCQTWLLFYRQSVVHPSRDTAWHDRSAAHLKSCTAQHADIS